MFHWAGTSTVGGALPEVKSGQPYIVSIGALCVEDIAKPAIVTGVTLRRLQGSMRILDWGFRSRHDGDPYQSGWKDPAAGPGLLARLPGFSKAPVAIGCHHTPPGAEAEFDVNVERGIDNIAVTHGFWVHYTVDGIPARALAPYTLLLCQAKCPPTKPMFRTIMSTRTR